MVCVKALAKSESDYNSPTTRRIWGRRIGRPLKRDRLEAMEKLLPVISIPLKKLSGEKNIDPVSLFFPPPKGEGQGGGLQSSAIDHLNPSPQPPPSGRGKFREYWFEIGFGDGAHLVALKRGYPDVGFLGAEPFINGVSALCLNLFKGCHPERSSAEQNAVEGSSTCPPEKIPPLPRIKSGVGRDDTLRNIRILADDALLLTRSLINQSIDRIYILNPDPWPKKRHHKRRIVCQKNLDEFARVMKSGGKLVMATDVDDLADWMVTECSNHPDFEWTAQSAKDWQTPPEEWIETKYAFKGKQAGRRQTFLVFKRLAKSGE